MSGRLQKQAETAKRRKDENGNIIVEQDGKFEEESVTYHKVTEEKEGVYGTDYGWGLFREKSDDSMTENRSFRRTYTWNERNQLIASSDNAVSVAYTYGQDGQRSNKYTANSETLYFNKMWTLHVDSGNAYYGGQNAKNIYLGETRIVTKLAGAKETTAHEETYKQYFYHSDHLGSASLISDYKGDEYQRIEYTPYGETWVEKTNNTGSEFLPYKFTAKEQDEETGLYYYGARYLDPKYSRWISTDPALGDYIPQAPISDEARKNNQNLPGMGGVFNHINSNLYAYAANNPVHYIDPDGRASILQRPINKGSKTAYNVANWFGTNLKCFLHGLVDYGDLTSTKQVSQYSGSQSGITTTDIDSKEREYKIIYTGMEDSLTKKAIDNVNQAENFGSGDTKGLSQDKDSKTNAGARYKIFKNDCNDYTAAVFDEYKKLWEEDFKSKNPTVDDRQVNKAWKDHYKDLTKRRGEWLKIEK